MMNNIFFNGSTFRLVEVYGHSDIQDFFKCLRCGHNTCSTTNNWNYEYDLATYSCYKNSNDNYLCCECVGKIVLPIRKCKYCKAQFTTGKNIIKHLINNHPI